MPAKRKVGKGKRKKVVKQSASGKVKPMRGSGGYPQGYAAEPMRGVHHQNGEGFFGDVWSGIKKGAKVARKVVNTAGKIGKKVIDNPLTQAFAISQGIQPEQLKAASNVAGAASGLGRPRFGGCRVGTGMNMEPAKCKF